MSVVSEQPRTTRIHDKMKVHPGPPTHSGFLNGMSVDVEDYFHVEAFADRIHPDTWSQYPRRVAANTRRVLEIFQESGARATFFVLGLVAEQEPALVREIVAAGHEVGCHSYLHRRVFNLTPQEFREDTRRARGIIEDAGGVKVVGYRAPTFSISAKSLWALEILAEEGFLYDSSVFPIRHDLYGMPNAPRFPFRWACGEGRVLYEIPPLTLRVLGRNVAVAGGGHLRILPMAFTRWAMRRIRQREGRAAIVYFHPWEVDPDQPRLPGKLKSRLRHYTNLRRMGNRVREILRGGEFVSLGAFLESQIENGQIQTELSPSAG
ncbi:MAG TPA: XrtA system polysaccharide deacetylase [Terriglobia bacterium]|nr:XrtA system polysaccharide deacetylase [Terriglobia bacterium]